MQGEKHWRKDRGYRATQRRGEKVIIEIIRHQEDMRTCISSKGSGSKLVMKKKGLRK